MLLQSRLLYPWRFFVCLFLLGGLTRQSTQAQLPAPNGRRVVSHKIVGIPGTMQFLEQCILATNGYAERPLLALPPRYERVAAAESGTRNLYLLRKSGADSVCLLLTDSLGRVLQQPRQYLPRAANLLIQPSVLGLPDGQGFVFTYPSGKGERSALHFNCLSLDLLPRWQQQLAPLPAASITSMNTSDTHLWVVLADRLPHVWNCRLTTGEVGCHVALGRLEQVDAVAVVPAGLLLLGSADHRYARPVRPGQTDESSGFRRDFALVVGPAGQESLATGLGWPAHIRPLYQWQSAYPLPGGGYQLIGETYHEVANAGAIALGMLGAGMVVAGGHGLIPTHYTTARPTGLLLAQLSATGELGSLQVLPVPEALRISSPAADSTSLPKGKPTSFRFRGLTTDGAFLVLNTSRQVLLYSFATRQLQPLTQPRTGTPTVLAIRAGRVAVGWAGGKTGENMRLPEFEQLLLP